MNYFTRELIEMGRSGDHAVLSRQKESEQLILPMVHRG